MAELETMLSTPLGHLLRGINSRVFSKMPHQVSTRELARSMSDQLGYLRKNEQYAIVTNRGMPAFLVLPIDPKLWMNLLVAAKPGVEFGSQPDSTLRTVDELDAVSVDGSDLAP